MQCGVELVTNPECVVLDEPTSGLDSYSAQSLIDILKKIADAGATVIVTIHQPPPPVVRKIDNLMLLLSGRLMYDGPTGLSLQETFSGNGFQKPDDYNIADWILVRSLFRRPTPLACFVVDIAVSYRFVSDMYDPAFLLFALFYVALRCVAYNNSKSLKPIRSSN